MNEYELMYVLHPRLTAEEIEAAVERISALVTGPGGEILSVDQWGRRRLAYPIDRNMEGYYVLSTFKASAEVVGSIEGQLNLAEDVLRHLLIRGIIPYEEPPRDERVPVERERSARPPRDDDRRPRDADASSEAAPESTADEPAAAVAEAPAAPAVAEAPATPAVAEVSVDEAPAEPVAESAAPADEQQAVAATSE